MSCNRKREGGKYGTLCLAWMQRKKKNGRNRGFQLEKRGKEGDRVFSFSKKGEGVQRVITACGSDNKKERLVCATDTYKNREEESLALFPR